jgi:hypothetical protein
MSLSLNTRSPRSSSQYSAPARHPLAGPGKGRCGNRVHAMSALMAPFAFFRAPFASLAIRKSLNLQAWSSHTVRRSVNVALCFHTHAHAFCRNPFPLISMQIAGCRPRRHFSGLSFAPPIQIRTCPSKILMRFIETLRFTLCPLPHIVGPLMASHEGSRLSPTKEANRLWPKILAPARPPVRCRQPWV